MLWYSCYRGIGYGTANTAMAALVFILRLHQLQLANLECGGIVQRSTGPAIVIVTAPDSPPDLRGSWTRVSKCEYGCTSSFLLPITIRYEIGSPGDRITEHKKACERYE